MKLYRGIKYLLSPLLFFVVGVFSITSLYSQGCKKLTILFTNDIHSSVKSKRDNYAQKILNRNGDTLLLSGGYAKLATIIKYEREKADRTNSALLLLDAGDIAIGSIYHSLLTTEAVEYNALAKLGYNAYTFGNHDFDFGIDTLIKMFAIAKEKNVAKNYPYLLCSNVDFIDKNHREKFKNNAQLKPYHIFNCNGLKIGVFGVLGQNAYDVIIKDGKKIIYTDAIESAKKNVEELKHQGVDYIIAISHGGTTYGPDKEYSMNDREKSEDGKMAKKIDGIDVIISGHDHDKINEPLIINNSIIGATCGYNTMLGKIVIEKNGTKNTLIDYELIPISKDVEDDFETSKWIDSISVVVENLFLSGYKFSPFDTVAILSKDYIRKVDTLCRMELGSLIADSYRDIALQYLKKENDKFVIGIAPYGTIRGNLYKGSVTYNDIFNVLPLGNNEKGIFGYPLVYGWLYGNEVVNLCELVETISPYIEDTRLFFSGVEYESNKNNIPFYRVSNVFINGIPIQKDSLYMLVTCSYTANLIKLLKSESFGILSGIPKNREGVVIDNFKDNLIKDYEGNEVTSWMAFSNYLKSNKLTIRENKKFISTKTVYFKYALIGVLILFIIVYFKMKKRR